MSKSKIVEAAGMAVAGTGVTSKIIEDAMAQATLDCAAKGITDPDKIRAAKLEARARVKAEIRAQQEAAAKGK
jgi:hypothetical protein